MCSDVTRLKVGNEDFLVAAMIERCPKTMMLRELLKNAIEAAMGAPPGERLVTIGARPVGGVPKLAIWNAGRGMNGQELRRMCNIATSIRKESGLDRNFGMGAKVASLPSNQRGLRYRSAHGGVVREVVMGKLDGIYGRILRPGPNGAPAEVLEVTAEAAAEGRDPSADWTEVVLFGNAEAQDTVADPYGGHPRSGPDWLTEAIRRRFLRLPEGLRLELEAGIGGLKAPRPVVTLAERLAGLEHHEAVAGPDGITLHYAFDPAQVAAGAGKGAGWESLAGVVFQDEFYALESGRDWLRAAPSFGVPFLARAVTVVVELPEGYPVMPEAYRAYLRYRHGRQAQLLVQDFAAMIEHHRPAWLLRLLAGAVATPAYAEEVRAEMGAMFRQLGVLRARMGRRPEVPGRARPAAVPEGAGAPAEPPPIETAPALHLLRDPDEIADRGLRHRAAVFYPETHQLHVNLNYPVVAEAVAALTAGAPRELEEEAVQEAARTLAERAMVLRIARVVVHALAKRSRPKEWNEAQLRSVLSAEALSIAADDLRAESAELRAGFAEAIASAPRARPDAA